MSGTTTQSTLTRTWFLVDGLVTGVNALAYLALHRLLPDVLGGSPALYLAVGAILAVVTIGLLVVARSGRDLTALGGLLAFVNVVWALTSFVVAIANPFGLTTIGVVWTAAQGLVVLAFGILQLRALRTVDGYPRALA